MSDVTTNGVCPATSINPADAEQAKGKAALELAAKRQSANALRVKCVEAFQLAETGYVSQMLLAAQYASEYTSARLLLGDSRTTVVSALEGELNRYSSSLVKADRMICVHWAHKLLTEGMGAEALNMAHMVQAIPYGHWDQAFCAMVQRTNKGGADETYILLPGVEAQAVEFFVHAVANSLSRKACVEKVQELKRTSATFAAELASKEAAAKKAEREEAAKKERKARAAQAKAAQEAQEANEKAALIEKAAKDAKDEVERKRLEEEGAKYRADLEEKRKKEDAAQFALQQAARDHATAASADRNAVKNQTYAEARKATQDNKAAKQAQGTTKKAAPAPAGENLIPTQGTVKDVGEWIANIILRHPNPNDVFADVIDHLANKPAARRCSTRQARKPSPRRSSRSSTKRKTPK